MAKLYFLGGENTAKRDSKEINEAAFRDAGKVPTIAVFPWARPSFDRVYAHRKRLFDYFRSLGAGTIDFADYNETATEIESKIECSDLLYFSGGLASVLVERLKKKSLDRLLRKYEGIIVGRSAGALALCKKCVVTKNRYAPTSRMISGIGLVRFGLKAHYKPSKDNELKILSRSQKIYAIPERSALVYNNGALSFIGTVFLFQNGEKIQVD
jgi:dipeptidase E